MGRKKKKEEKRKKPRVIKTAGKLVEVPPKLTKEYGLKLKTKNQSILYLGCYYKAGMEPDVLAGDRQNVFKDEKFGKNLHYKSINIMDRERFLAEIGLGHAAPTRMFKELENFAEIKHISWTEYEEGKPLTVEIKGQSPIILYKVTEKDTQRVRRWKLLVGGYDIRHKYFATIIAPLMPKLHEFSLYGVRFIIYLMLKYRFNLKKLKNEDKWIINFNRKYTEEQIGMNILRPYQRDSEWINNILKDLVREKIIKDVNMGFASKDFMIDSVNDWKEGKIRDSNYKSIFYEIFKDRIERTTRGERRELDRKRKPGEMRFNIDLTKFRISF